MKKKYRRSGHCAHCGVFRESLHRDHIKAKWQGGLDVESNIQYICANCHEDKTLAELRTPEFASYQGELSLQRWLDADMRKKTQDAMQGVPKSKETRRRMSEAARAYRATPEGKAALDRAREMTKNGWTLEARQNASKKQKERLQDPAARAKCGVSVLWPEERKRQQSIRQLGLARPRKKGYTPLSDEHKAALEEGKRKRREYEATLTPAQKLQSDLDRAQLNLEKLEARIAAQKARAS